VKNIKGSWIAKEHSCLLSINARQNLYFPRRQNSPSPYRRSSLIGYPGLCCWWRPMAPHPIEEEQGVSHWHRTGDKAESLPIKSRPPHPFSGSPGSPAPADVCVTLFRSIIRSFHESPWLSSCRWMQLLVKFFFYLVTPVHFGLKAAVFGGRFFW